MLFRSWLNEQSLREIYTRSFEIAVKEGGANAIMSGFNKVGATWSGGNYSLLTGLLRDEWGFRGSIITDYALEWEMSFMDINQGIRAGNSLWLNGLRTDTIGTINNRSDSTTISCARKAVKDILFTFCNTMYRQSEYLKNPIDTAPKSELVGKAFTVAPVVWLWTLIIVFDVVVVLGILTWTFFVWFFPMIRKGKKKETEPIEPTKAE